MPESIELINSRFFENYYKEIYSINKQVYSIANSKSATSIWLTSKKQYNLDRFINLSADDFNLLLNYIPPYMLIVTPRIEPADFIQGLQVIRSQDYSTHAIYRQHRNQTRVLDDFNNEFWELFYNILKNHPSLLAVTFGMSKELISLISDTVTYYFELQKIITESFCPTYILRINTPTIEELHQAKTNRFHATKIAANFAISAAL